MALLELVRRRHRRRRGETAIVAAMIRSVRRRYRRSRTGRRRRNVGGRRARRRARRAPSGSRPRRRRPFGTRLRRRTVGIHRDRRDAAWPRNRRRGHRGGRARPRGPAGAAPRDSRRADTVVARSTRRYWFASIFASTVTRRSRRRHRVAAPLPTSSAPIRPDHDDARMAHRRAARRALHRDRRPRPRLERRRRRAAVQRRAGPTPPRSSEISCATHCRNIRSRRPTGGAHARDRDEPFHDPDRRRPGDDRVLRRPARARAGPRPPFTFPGAWLYAGGQPILHVVGGRPRDELRAGVIDHMAFSATGLADDAAKLEPRGVAHDCRRLPAADVAAVLPRPERCPGRARLRRRRSRCRADEAPAAEPDHLVVAATTLADGID